MERSRPLAAILYVKRDGAGVDQLVNSVATWLGQLGYTLAGSVQINRPSARRGGRDMVLRDLASDSLIEISEDRGTGARGCRLDHAAFVDAVELSRRGLEAEADMLIVNKFGKREAEGSGYRPVIAAAIERGVPVLLAVRDEHLWALEQFAGVWCEIVPFDEAAVRRWCLGALA